MTFSKNILQISRKSNIIDWQAIHDLIEKMLLNYCELLCFFSYIENNVTSTVRFLLSCPDCLVMDFNSTMDEVHIRSLYIFGRCVCAHVLLRPL